jgi:hypothetical protein
MTFDEVFNVCRERGVRLHISADVLRAQGRAGAVNDALKNGLREHKQAIISTFGNGVWPDGTLPDVILIPVSTPNTLENIKACVDAQRVQRAA